VDETASEQKIEQIIAGLDDLLEEYLDKPCAPLIDIQSGSVRDMRDALLDMIRLILSDEVSLKSLGGQSLLDFLVACIEQKSEEDVSWGVRPLLFRLKKYPSFLALSSRKRLALFLEHGWPNIELRPGSYIIPCGVFKRLMKFL
jgi:hypothetical protein